MRRGRSGEIAGLRTSFLVLGVLGFACTETGQIFTLVDDVGADAPSGGLSGDGGMRSMGGAPEGGTTGASGGDPSSGGTSLGSGGMPGSMGGAPALAPGPSGTSVHVDSGDVHTCAVVDGALYCWGDNQNGALGLDDFESRTTPTRVGDALDWESVGAGGDFTCGLRDGSVWCFGGSSSGQLGVGRFTLSAVPLQVSLPAAVGFIATGDEHACAILDDGRLFCWGQNTEGQLAQGDPWSGPGVDSDVPLQVAVGDTFRSVACGQGHTCAIRTDGMLFCWGRNAMGELGLGEGSSGQLREPALVGAATDWLQVSAGQNHTCGIRAGELYCWGDNGHSQLGFPSAEFVSEPTAVPGVADAVAVSVDTFHTCAVQEGGELYCWGRNIEGQLGDGTNTGRDAPAPSIPMGSWNSISSGRFHTCGVREGEILCTGENPPGRLGTGDSERRRAFTTTSYFP